MQAQTHTEAVKPAGATRAAQARPAQSPLFSYRLLKVKTGLKAGNKHAG
jgi:hypothetical protein